MEIIKCDRCDKTESKRVGEWFRLHFYDSKANGMSIKDLCPDCKLGFLRFMNTQPAMLRPL